MCICLCVPDSPLPLVEDGVVDSLYGKYCHGDQPVAEGGSEIEIEHSADDGESESNSSDTEVRCSGFCYHRIMCTELCCREAKESMVTFFVLICRIASMMMWF